MHLYLLLRLYHKISPPFTNGIHLFSNTILPVDAHLSSYDTMAPTQRSALSLLHLTSASYLSGLWLHLTPPLISAGLLSVALFDRSFGLSRCLPQKTESEYFYFGQVWMIIRAHEESDLR